VIYETRTACCHSGMKDMKLYLWRLDTGWRVDISNTDMWWIVQPKYVSKSKIQIKCVHIYSCYPYITR